MTDARHAAMGLLTFAALPRSVASVNIVDADDGVVLILRVDPGYEFLATRVPTQFCGYDVRVEPREDHVILN